MGWLGTQQSSIWDKDLRRISIEEMNLVDIQRWMREQTKNLNEKEISKLYWENEEILLIKVRELNLEDIITQKLVLEGRNSQTVNKIQY